MQWYISKLIDSEVELHERIQFYSELSKREIQSTITLENYYSFNDGRNDNRCMVVGHTDAAFDVVKYLKKKSGKRYKVYLCVCSMSCEYLLELSKKAADYEFFVSKQDNIIIGKKAYSGCRFLDVNETRLRFRATESELLMYNSKFVGFFNKLENSFTAFKKHK